ncbi:AraC family transcriptional regulator [Vibrio sp. 16]|uniref:AraC family transcriptional regulator n=1 Tax=Vibrio sp. 16 TaxID=391586 RepID=UPI00018F2BBC|nr:AraC family transcriptional regulator [Vibrio sp. 16]EED28575.1 transcriptional regulator, AraC family [Vibrio sp. 16]CAK4074968.1 RCS-specific HTH-type transcriptional activator RclR [Vibrio sp. 16]
MDLLSQLMEHFSIRTGVFHSGRLCGISSFKDRSINQGHLHVLNAGHLKLVNGEGKAQLFTQPCVIYLPSSAPHTIEAVGEVVELVCANVEYRAGKMNPLLSALPELIVIPFESAPSLTSVVDMLFTESDSVSVGQQFLMDTLSDTLMALIFRYLIEAQKIERGLFSALAHPRLEPVVSAVHQLPARHFQIAEMAALAAMSRSQFTETFKQAVGETPGEYVQKWRISVAQSLLLQSKPLNWVADEVGYSSYSGFARAFQQVCGVSPRQWLQDRAG